MNISVYLNSHVIGCILSPGQRGRVENWGEQEIFLRLHSVIAECSGLVYTVLEHKLWTQDEYKTNGLLHLHGEGKQRNIFPCLPEATFQGCQLL